MKIITEYKSYINQLVSGIYNSAKHKCYFVTNTFYTDFKYVSYNIDRITYNIDILWKCYNFFTVGINRFIDSHWTRNRNNSIISFDFIDFPGTKKHVNNRETYCMRPHLHSLYLVPKSKDWLFAKLNETNFKIIRSRAELSQMGKPYVEAVAGPFDDDQSYLDYSGKFASSQLAWSGENTEFKTFGIFPNWSLETLGFTDDPTDASNHGPH